MPASVDLGVEHNLRLVTLTRLQFRREVYGIHNLRLKRQGCQQHPARQEQLP